MSLRKEILLMFVILMIQGFNDESVALDLPLYILIGAMVGYPLIAAWGFLMAVKEAVKD